MTAQASSNDRRETGSKRRETKSTTREPTAERALKRVNDSVWTGEWIETKQKRQECSKIDTHAHISESFTFKSLEANAL